VSGVVNADLQPAADDPAGDDEAEELVRVDGRTARRDRNQLAVLDAALELFREGNLAPKPEEVANRSGISLRSVYRYFSEPPALLLAAMARHVELVEPLWYLPGLGQGSLDERVERLIAARIELYEKVGPTARAARLAAITNPLIHDQFRRGRDRLRSQIEAHFAPELQAMPEERHRAVAAAVDVLFQLDGLEYYMVYRALSVAQTSAWLKIAVLTQLSGS